MHGFKLKMPITWLPGMPHMGRIDFWIGSTQITYCMGRFNYEYPTNLKTIPYIVDPLTTPVIISENEDYSYLGVGHHLMIGPDYPVAGESIIVVDGSTASGYTYGFKQGAYNEATSGWFSDYIEFSYYSTSSNSATVKVNNLTLNIPTLPTCSSADYGQFPVHSIKFGDMQPDIPLYGNLPNTFNITICNYAVDDKQGSINIGNGFPASPYYYKKFFTIGDIELNCNNSIVTGEHSTQWENYKAKVNGTPTSVGTLIRRAPYWYYTGSYSPFGPWYMKETDTIADGCLTGGYSYQTTEPTYVPVNLYWDIGISTIIKRSDGTQMLCRTGKDASYEVYGTSHSTRVWVRKGEDNPWQPESEWEEGYNGIGYDYKSAPGYFPNDDNLAQWTQCSYPYNIGSNGEYTQVIKQMGLLGTCSDGYTKWFAKGHRQNYIADLLVNTSEGPFANAGISGVSNVGNKTQLINSNGAYPESLFNLYGWESTPFNGSYGYNTYINPQVLNWWFDKRDMLPGAVSWISLEQDGTDSVVWWSLDNYVYKIADTTGTDVYPWCYRRDNGLWRVLYVDNNVLYCYDSSTILGNSWVKVSEATLIDYKPMYYINCNRLKNGEYVVLGVSMDPDFPIQSYLGFWIGGCPSEMKGPFFNMPLDYFCSPYLFERTDGQYEIGILTDIEQQKIYRSYDLTKDYTDWVQSGD